MTTKPSKHEDRHIWEEELKSRLRKQAEEQQATTEAEKRRLKELHWWKEANNGVDRTQDFQGDLFR